MVRAILKGASVRSRPFSGKLMGENPNRDEPPSLDAFSVRLERMRAQGQETRPQGSASAWGRAMRISSDLLAGLFVGCLLGLGLDHWLETQPAFLLVGMALGFAAGLRNMMRTLKEQNEQPSDT
ncbi:AtpZ/AtpI family protein [Hyphococcus sp.]|uniref:AtpZ/AtpI family protein n=1 Tax=Hyphococcus sp. TaxID=2038636 RepID=UPI003CCBD7DC